MVGCENANGRSKPFCFSFCDCFGLFIHLFVLFFNVVRFIFIVVSLFVFVFIVVSLFVFVLFVFFQCNWTNMMDRSNLSRHISLKLVLMALTF